MVTKAKSRIQTKFLLFGYLFQLNQNLDENQTKDFQEFNSGMKKNAVVMDSWYDMRSKNVFP